MKTPDIVLGGVLAGLALVIMLLGGVIPVATYITPMLASLLLIGLLDRLKKPACFGWFAVTALLGILLCPDRETALVFLALGWYPIVCTDLNRLPKAFRLMVKLLIFNTAVGVMYGLMIFVFQMQALVEEAKEMTLWLLILLLVLGNVTFLLFDRLLQVFRIYYHRRFGRPGSHN